MSSHGTEQDLLQVWRFVRGDMRAEEFEKWAYSSTRLEAQLGADLYLDVISANYRDRDAVQALKERLRSWVQGVEQLSCRCVTLSDLSVVDMGAHDEVFAFLDLEASRGKPFWWLSTYRCSACGEWWLVAQEERHNDVFCMRRLRADEVSGIMAKQSWPPDFDRYEDLLRIGRDAGKAVYYLEPLKSSSLQWTIEDLARVRPGIHVSEMASLLNLDHGIATMLARAVVERTGVSIQFYLGETS